VSAFTLHAIFGDRASTAGRWLRIAALYKLRIDADGDPTGAADMPPA
jgi:hypothetical protein